MTTTKGMLHSGPIGEPPRMTAGQKDLVARAIHAVFVHAQHVPPTPATSILYHAAEAAIIEILNTYPEDRSCVTCDFYIGETCTFHKAAVPEEFIEQGCDDWQQHGAPF